MPLRLGSFRVVASRCSPFNFRSVPEAQPSELSGPGCTMLRGSDRQHSSHLPLLPGFLPSTPTHSCYRLAEALARHMFQKKVFLYVLITRCYYILCGKYVGWFIIAEHQSRVFNQVDQIHFLKELSHPHQRLGGRRP